MKGQAASKWNGGSRGGGIIDGGIIDGGIGDSDGGIVDGRIEDGGLAVVPVSTGDAVAMAAEVTAVMLKIFMVSGCGVLYWGRPRVAGRLSWKEESES